MYAQTSISRDLE